MNEQKELTKAELQIMQVLWQKENAFVNEILQELEEPRPAYNTVSTVLRVLQNKGFVAYRSFERIINIIRWFQKRVILIVL